LATAHQRSPPTLKTYETTRNTPTGRRDAVVHQRLVSRCGMAHGRRYGRKLSIHGKRSYRGKRPEIQMGRLYSIRCSRSWPMRAADQKSSDRAQLLPDPAARVAGMGGIRGSLGRTDNAVAPRRLRQHHGEDARASFFG